MSIEASGPRPGRSRSTPIPGWVGQLLHRVLGRHTDRVLKSATAIVRGAALVLIAADLFTGQTATGPGRTAQVTCFAVGTASVIVWAGVDAWRRPRGERGFDQGWLVVLFVVMAA